jgi:hypothetical protein
MHTKKSMVAISSIILRPSNLWSIFLYMNLHLDYDVKWFNTISALSDKYFIMFLLTQKALQISICLEQFKIHYDKYLKVTSGVGRKFATTLPTIRLFTFATYFLKGIF